MKLVRPLLLLILSASLTAPTLSLAGSFRLGATRVCVGNLGHSRNKNGAQIKVCASALKSTASRNAKGYTARIDVFPFVAKPNQSAANLWAFYE